MKKVRILLLGSGARENAIAHAITKSRHANDIALWVAPGNAGTNGISKRVPELILSGNEFCFKQIGDFTIEHEISIVIVGGEELLCAGIVDYFASRQYLASVKIIGPNQMAAMLEGSKSFAKKFMKDTQIPTAKYEVFDDHESACNYVVAAKYPLVIKADGLAAGKGVVIVTTTKEALYVLEELMLNRKHEGAGKKVVIEEFLPGKELSVFIAMDGKYNYRLLPTADDYKKLGTGNTGPNTGGMGANSPSLNADNAFMEKVKQRIIKPTIKGLREKNLSYKGFLFFGLMRVGDDPFLLEYNCRLGDPEAVVILPRLESDFVDLLYAMTADRLDGLRVVEKETFAACVALVAKGYPGSYEKGHVVSFPKKVESGKIVFAGASLNEKKEVITNGGRVAQLYAEGKTLDDALHIIYRGILPLVSFEGVNYRTDIGNFYHVTQPFTT